jgi:hypothetical protein
MLAATALSATVLLSQAVASPIVSIVRRTKHQRRRSRNDRYRRQRFDRPGGGLRLTSSSTDTDGVSSTIRAPMVKSMTAAASPAERSPLDIFFVADPRTRQAALARRGVHSRR